MNMDDENFTILYVNKGMYCIQMLVQFSPFGILAQIVVLYY